MQRRPKPGETEEDLLEFQKQFLAQKTTPSVSVISKKPGEKRTIEKQDDHTEPRDVVQMDALPTTLPASDHVPPTKKSRFKAAQEQKAKLKQARTQPPASHDIDKHDRSTGTVLAKIIERDTHNARYSLPGHVTLPFPALSQVDNTSVQADASTKKKKSLFAQQVASAPEKFGIVSDEPPSVLQMDTKESNTDEEMPSIIDGSGLSATFGKTEAHKIHEENLNCLSQMSEEEVLEEQRKLMQTLDPKLVAFLKAKKVASDGQTEHKHEPERDSVWKPDNKQTPGKSSQDTEVPVPVEVKKDWVHMDDVEYDKLEWMKDLPAPSADSTKTGQQARFDFHGNLVHDDADIPVNVGLHHHGDEPERAGYTLEELFTLARSTNNQQRVLALNTLSKVIKQAKEGNLEKMVQTPILPGIIDAGVIFLLRWSLDDSVESVVAAAVVALNSLLVNHADELAQGKVFHWYQGHRVACQAPAKPEDVGIKLPGESEEKPEETDADLAKQDLILALGSRMNLIQRLTYILRSVRPQAPVVIAVLQLLARLCRHSKQLAYQVFNYKGLLELVIKEFLPITWDMKGVQEPVSNVYGVPLKEAMRLICTLCQAGKNMATVLLSRFQIEERLQRFLLTDTKSSGLPGPEAHGLQMECLNTWKVCLTYGLADGIYIEYYSLIIEQFRHYDGVLDRPREDQDRVAALVSCLETAVCVATSQRKTQTFKHSQDGDSREVEMSEDVAMATINWTHVADLIQPIRIMLRSMLSDLANSFQIKKQSLQVPIACLNFITTYYVHCQTQLHGADIVNSLQEMEQIYTDCIQHWNSIGFSSILSLLSMKSNFLQCKEKCFEECSCLPECGNSSMQEDQFVPVVSSQSPCGFLTAWYRMVYSFSKVHRGLQSAKQQSAGEASLVSPLVVLQSPDLWSYLRKVAKGTSHHQNCFTRLETLLLYFVVKLATIMSSADNGVDMTVVHQVSLRLLTSIQYGDEYLIHDLLSTLIFSPVYFRLESTEATTVKLGEMTLSAPIHLHTATAEQIAVVSEQLLNEAQQNLNSIRACYLAAFSHSEQQVMASRSHYVGDTVATDGCFTSNIGESVMPKDWMFLPLIELYNKYSTVGAEVQNILSSSQLDSVRNVLRWIYLMESCRTYLLEGVSVTLKLSRIMCAFLTGNDMFLDRTVHCFLAGLLRVYTKPAILNKMDFSEHIPGLPSFYDLYVSLLLQYEAVSFGDSLFACYILIALQQRHSVLYRKAIWTEYAGILRTLALPLNELLLPVQLYLEPEETNVELIRLYYQSLYGGTLRPCWCPVLYLVAVHHVNRFMYTQDRTHTKLKCSMMSQILKSNNEVLEKHLKMYKQADVTKDFGMELYETLPAIRRTFIDSLKIS
ncbi:RNA polymerase II-associated protein 1-like [Mercenaria mercenaria]|uniref:RNA polymerase II-associated protein 1-like n=1 Tax=Mercenaria mercenaria TaxID=6596 RepID=UPI00234EFC23|nr:RNA polymerase II-associated protein 1-like [Mercenaria mercenaria]XP_045186716.2 RNA polymerase II-associated protein 1-like [Mercenaria mercenaria]XP_053397374.1 RNA polymerase II-associated protein 1-like [Mercenaria mercenaria]